MISKCSTFPINFNGHTLQIKIEIQHCEIHLSEQPQFVQFLNPFKVAIWMNRLCTELFVEIYISLYKKIYKYSFNVCIFRSLANNKNLHFLRRKILSLFIMRFVIFFKYFNEQVKARDKLRNVNKIY